MLEGTELGQVSWRFEAWVESILLEHPPSHCKQSARGPEILSKPRRRMLDQILCTLDVVFVKQEKDKDNEEDRGNAY